MDMKLEHASIIDKNNQLFTARRNGDIQSFLRLTDFWSTLYIQHIVMPLFVRTSGVTMVRVGWMPANHSAVET
jgi:hypothetical protein